MSWFACFSPRPNAAVRLYCLPHAGGGAATYRDWSAELPESVEVHAARLPGRESRFVEPPCERFDELVRELAAHVAPATAGYALYGHSMGALLAFEVARRLRSGRGASPRHVFVSGMNAPQVPRRPKGWHRLPDAELIERIRHFGGTDPRLTGNAEFWAATSPALRADFAACDDYVYRAGEPLACPVTCFNGLDDPETSVPGLLAWGELTGARFDLVHLPGGHFFPPASLIELRRRIATALRPAVQSVEPTAAGSAPGAGDASSGQ